MTFPLAQLLSPVLASSLPPPYNPITDIPGLVFFNSYRTITATDAIIADNVSHGPFPGRRISGTPPAMSCNISNAGLSSIYAGSSAAFAGYNNAGNNGAFSVTSADLVLLSYRNPAGVAEPTGVSVPTVATATVSILGLATSYTEQVAGYVFSQPTQNERFAVNDTEVPGKRVLGVEGNRNRSFGCVSIPLASQLDGTTPFTAFQYFRATTFNASGSSTQWMNFRDATNTNRIAIAHGAATNGTVVTASSAGTTTQTGVLSPAMQLNTWQLLAVTHTGTTATWFINGVQVATHTIGTQRVRANLERVYVGGVPGATQGFTGHRAVAGAVARVMTPTELLNLTAWCQAEYAA